jgi:hypothetical protein
VNRELGAGQFDQCLRGTDMIPVRVGQNDESDLRGSYAERRHAF